MWGRHEVGRGKMERWGESGRSQGGGVRCECDQNIWKFSKKVFIIKKEKEKKIGFQIISTSVQRYKSI